MNKKIRCHELVKNDSVRIGRFTIVSLEDKSGIRAVGIARRSDLDSNNGEMAKEVALGRAERALTKKKLGKKIQHVLMG